ncbi:MAG: tyrosine-type recombinase/integrase, partial [Ornithinimicrobium sp.]
EALRLQIPDLDITGNMLHVHATKTPLDRLVPLDPSTTKVLVDYLTLPERLSTDPSPTGPIFVNNRGTGLVVETIEQHFRALSDALDLARPGQPPPRLHDLRHTFATGHMIAAYTSGADPPER